MKSKLFQETTDFISHAKSGKENITLYNCALSDREGTTTLRVPIRRKTIFKSNFEEKYHIGLGTIHKDCTFDNFDEFSIKTMKLDDIKFSNKVSFIKIDVEGHELNVIDGAKETLKKHKPNLIIEIEEKHSKIPLLESINYIQNLNYKLYVAHNDALLEIKDYKKLNRDINFIFIPKR